jgi:4'-phosphopantetheinyl transferase
MNKRKYNLQNQNHITLADQEVHVWNFNLDKIIVIKDKFVHILSNDELHRAEKFHFERDRNWYICSRGLLRILLGIYTDIPSTQINFTFNDYGKPSLLSDQNNDLHFNLSHSKNFMSVGFTKHALIGVDVELVKPFKDHLEIAKRFFSANEVEQLLSFPSEKLLNVFYSCWTAKESVIKLSGEGLSYPLKDFDVQLKDLAVTESYKYKANLKKRDENLFVEVYRIQEDLFGACAINKDNTEILHCGFEAEESSISYLLNKLTH